MEKNFEDHSVTAQWFITVREETIPEMRNFPFVYSLLVPPVMGVLLVIAIAVDVWHGQPWVWLWKKLRKHQ